MTTAVINTGFAHIILNPGPDTMRVTVQRENREMIFSLTQGECEMLADLLGGYAKRREERKL